MEIRSLYHSFLKRLYGTDRKVENCPAGGSTPVQTEKSDRCELSKMATLLQEAESLGEEKIDSSRLRELEEKIQSGAYEIDPRKLAKAMLPSPGDLPGPQGENQ